MPFADLSLALEPAWPWSLPTILGIALALAALTVWTYLGVKKATWRRVLAVLILRLLALAVAFSMMMRPSFAFSELAGVELTKLLVVFDKSESMNVAETAGKPSRWEQTTKLWGSRNVQRRLQQLRAEQKIEVVKYLAAEDLQPDDPAAVADGKRTDIGGWLHELLQKHGHEKHLRGIVLISDGADNGTRYSTQEKARAWRGIAPIHAFGVGNPNDPNLRKDIGLTTIAVTPKPTIPVKSKMTVTALAQAPGFANAKLAVSVWLQDDKKKAWEIRKIPDFEVRQEKDAPIVVECDAPDLAGEYKVTMKIEPQPGEANKDNNEISTFVHVIKQKINILWVDRLRVYEPTYALRFALLPEERFSVRYVVPPSAGKGDPLKFYGLGQHYDVIVIGDLSAQQFSMGDAKVFERIKKMVAEEDTGLLMLGGTETFANGGWDQYPALMDLLPVDFKADKIEFSKTKVRAVPAGGNYPFLNLELNKANNDKLWLEQFEPLEGLAPVGNLRKDSVIMLHGENDKDKIVMAATRKGIEGHVVVFAGDSTAAAWRGSKDAIAGYKTFWKQLVYWLAKAEDQGSRLQIELDKRRLNANAAEILSFNFSLRDKAGKAIPNARFNTKIVGPDSREYPVTTVAKGAKQFGTFQGKEPGEYRLIVSGEGTDRDDKGTAEARFLVAFDDIEMLRPLANHETLGRIAAESDGRFYVLDEAALLQYLDELKSEVNREARHKTTYWPDWKRMPASDHPRDQLAGLWHSFALVSFLLFVGLLGCEWLLRRLWGLV